MLKKLYTFRFATLLLIMLSFLNFGTIGNLNAEEKEHNTNVAIKSNDQSTALLEGISIDGIAIEDFDPNVYEYNIDIEADFLGLSKISWGSQ